MIKHKHDLIEVTRASVSGNSCSPAILKCKKCLSYFILNAKYDKIDRIEVPKWIENTQSNDYE